VVIEALLAAGAKVQAYDPVAMKEAKHVLGYRILYTEDAISAAKDADAILLVTEWNEFRLPDWKLIKENMKDHVLFDGRNIYNAKDIAEKGFTYYCIGIKTN
jgi:UDPglucose 6-dehydrogenase